MSGLAQLFSRWLPRMRADSSIPLLLPPSKRVRGYHQVLQRGERTDLSLEGERFLQLSSGTRVGAGDILQLHLDEHLIILTGSEPTLHSGKRKARSQTPDPPPARRRKEHTANEDRCRHGRVGTTRTHPYPVFLVGVWPLFQCDSLLVRL